MHTYLFGSRSIKEGGSFTSPVKAFQTNKCSACAKSVKLPQKPKSKSRYPSTWSTTQFAQNNEASCAQFWNRNDINNFIHFLFCKRTGTNLNSQIFMVPWFLWPCVRPRVQTDQKEFSLMSRAEAVSCREVWNTGWGFSHSVIHMIREVTSEIEGFESMLEASMIVRASRDQRITDGFHFLLYMRNLLVEDQVSSTSSECYKVNHILQSDWWFERGALIQPGRKHVSINTCFKLCKRGHLKDQCPTALVGRRVIRWKFFGKSFQALLGRGEVEQ